MKMYQLGYIYQLDRVFDFLSSYLARKKSESAITMIEVTLPWNIYLNLLPLPPPPQ